MKKKLCALILAMACVCSLGTTGASAYSAKTEHSLRMSGALFR